MPPMPLLFDALCFADDGAMRRYAASGAIVIASFEDAAPSSSLPPCRSADHYDVPRCAARTAAR